MSKLRFVKIESSNATRPKSGIWPLMRGGHTPLVFAPCKCCDDFQVYEVEPEQIISRDQKLTNADVIFGGRRRDGHRFYLTRKRGRAVVNAGCRHLSFKSAREHWKQTRGGTALGRWTMKELSRLEATARKRKWVI